MDHARVFFRSGRGGDRSDIRHHINHMSTDGHALASHDQERVPHAAIPCGTRTSRSCDPHTRTRYAHDALYDERIHAIRRFRQGFHQGQGHDDDAVRVVCIRVYTCMRVLETRRAHMDMRPRARAMMMMMSRAMMAHPWQRPGSRSGRGARARAWTRARDASRAMAYRGGCFCFIRACAVRS